jgi:hypothetical protein
MRDEINRISRILDDIPYELSPFANYLRENDIEKLAVLVKDKYAPVIKRYLLVYFREISIRLTKPIPIQKIAELLEISSKSYSRAKYEMKQAGIVDNFLVTKKRLTHQIEKIFDQLEANNIIALHERIPLEIIAKHTFEELDLVLSPQLKPNLAVMLAMIIRSQDPPFSTFDTSFDKIYADTMITRDDVWPFIKNTMYHYPKYFPSRREVEV